MLYKLNGAHLNEAPCMVNYSYFKYSCSLAGLWSKNIAVVVIDDFTLCAGYRAKCKDIEFAYLHQESSTKTLALSYHVSVKVDQTLA